MAHAIIIRPLPVVAAVASSDLTAAFNVANDYAGVVWRSAGASFVDLVLDLGSDRSIDSIALFGIDLAPSSATLQIFASAAAAGTTFAPPSWSGVPAPLYAGASMPASGKGIALWQAPEGFPAGIRHVLLRFAGLAGGAVQVARAVIGQRIQLERNFSYGASFGVRDLGSLDFSARGVLLRRRGARLRTVGLTFSHLRKDEVEQTVQPLLEQIGNTEMVALVTDPAADAQRQRRCYFGPLVGDIGTVRRNAAAYEAKANLVSIF